MRAAVDPPGAAKTDLEICKLISARLGYELPYDGPEDVMAEIAELTPDFAGVTYERLEGRGLQWPIAPDGTDAPILYEETFDLMPGGRAHLAALPYKEPGDEASEEFPLILVTGRRLEHYNVGTMTRRTGNLDLLPKDWLEIHPDDAAELGLVDGDAVKVRSAQRRDRDRGGDHRAHRPGPRVHRVPLPRGAHEPARRPERGREHELPRVQGHRGRRHEARRRREERPQPSPSPKSSTRVSLGSPRPTLETTEPAASVLP